MIRLIRHYDTHSSRRFDAMPLPCYEAIITQATLMLLPPLTPCHAFDADAAELPRRFDRRQ